MFSAYAEENTFSHSNVSVTNICRPFSPNAVVNTKLSKNHSVLCFDCNLGSLSIPESVPIQRLSESYGYKVVHLRLW